MPQNIFYVVPLHIVKILFNKGLIVVSEETHFKIVHELLIHPI